MVSGRVRKEDAMSSAGISEATGPPRKRAKRPKIPPRRPVPNLKSKTTENPRLPVEVEHQLHFRRCLYTFSDTLGFQVFLPHDPEPLLLEEAMLSGVVDLSHYYFGREVDNISKEMLPYYHYWQVVDELVGAESTLPGWDIAETIEVFCHILGWVKGDLGSTWQGKTWFRYGHLLNLFENNRRLQIYFEPPFVDKLPDVLVQKVTRKATKERITPEVRTVDLADFPEEFVIPIGRDIKVNEEIPTELIGTLKKRVVRTPKYSFDEEDPEPRAPATATTTATATATLNAHVKAARKNIKRHRRFLPSNIQCTDHSISPIYDKVTGERYSLKRSVEAGHFDPVLRQENKQCFPAAMRKVVEKRQLYLQTEHFRDLKAHYVKRVADVVLRFLSTIQSFLPTEEFKNADLLTELLASLVKEAHDAGVVRQRTPLHVQISIPNGTECAITGVQRGWFKESSLTEVKESLPTEMYNQVVRLSWLLMEGKSKQMPVTVFTGAGISTGAGAALPTVRGVGKSSAFKFDPHVLEVIKPTLSHMVIKALLDKKLVSFVCTQNIEDLHRASGIPRSKLWEIHGNLFDFECSTCHSIFDERSPPPEFDMLCPKCSKGDPSTEYWRRQKNTRHSGLLRRKVVRHYGEAVKPAKSVLRKFRKTKISLVIGTSLQVGGVARFACPDNTLTRPLLVVVNKGSTKQRVDNWAQKNGIKIDESADVVFGAVAKLLNITPEVGKCSNRLLLREQGETDVDLCRLFFGERKSEIKGL